ncbi:hypothetical protein V5T82_10965 [Magnetovibrio sp. PR-2]|uniref:hypothetical protein n=1 Tax=Magnetovibrio sp. PR-2 TaxID=3120356 RepID=UPI002FCE0172
MQTLDNGLTVERQSSALSSPMTAASASVVGKLSQITPEPEAPVEDVDVMGNSVNKGSSIAQTQMGSLAQSGKPGPNAAKSPAAGTLAYTVDPTKAPIASRHTLSQADIDKMQAAKAKVETDRVKAEEKKQKEEEAVMKGMFSQIAAAQDKARKSKEFHPAYGLTDQGRRTEIAKEHHPAYGYTNTGDGLLAGLKSDIKQSIDPRAGVSARGQQLASLYNSLPSTKALTSKDGLLASPVTGQNKRNSATFGINRPSIDLINDVAAPATTSAVDLSRAATSKLSDSWTRMGMGINTLINPGLNVPLGWFGLERTVDWDAVDRQRSWQRNLLETSKKSPGASKIGQTVGDVGTFAIEMSALAPGLMATIGETKENLHRNNVTGREARIGMTYGVTRDLLSDRVGKIGSIAGRYSSLFNKIGVNVNLLSTSAEEAISKGFEKTMDWLAEKDDENPKAGKGD